MFTFTLTVNDPREGWKYAVDFRCKNLDEALARVTVKRAEHRRFGFALRVETKDSKFCKTFVWRRGKFIGLTDNVPIQAWLDSSKGVA